MRELDVTHVTLVSLDSFVTVHMILVVCATHKSLVTSRTPGGVASKCRCSSQFGYTLLFFLLLYIAMTQPYRLVGRISANFSMFTYCRSFFYSQNQFPLNASERPNQNKESSHPAHYGKIKDGLFEIISHSCNRLVSYCFARLEVYYLSLSYELRSALKKEGLTLLTYPNWLQTCIFIPLTCILLPRCAHERDDVERLGVIYR